ncbi:hypothetical protein PACTADRAFT_38743 [Pachysolen tannophilus NRRL Y-2460]|uniref:Programmed cell death protein 5 n=1 Tax=Pachysolen tannophilus NRRL Y-2460 TaxID=669874 RepID=A0A1E4U0A8_PACTA|nr:hypothetical protein PACTADRAFT_38743 [Pachysolen tannophilus NRRL Y-2460]
MDDAELNAIRAARLSELQKNSGQSSGSGNSKENQRSSILSQILEPEARERLSRVKLVRPERAQVVEEYLTKLVRMGQLRRKMGEDELVSLLDNLSRDQQSKMDTKIVFDRRQLAGESDDESEDDFFK